MKSICDANVNMGVVKSVIYKRTGHTVTLQVCHYLSSLNDDLKRMANLSELSSADTIIDFLKSKKYEYITLFNSAVTDRNPIQSPLMSENNLTSKRLYLNTSFVIPPNERRDAVEFTEDNRSNRNLTNEATLNKLTSLLTRRKFINQIRYQIFSNLHWLSSRPIFFIQRLEGAVILYYTCCQKIFLFNEFNLPLIFFLSSTISSLSHHCKNSFTLIKYKKIMFCLQLSHIPNIIVYGIEK